MMPQTLQPGDMWFLKSQRATELRRTVSPPALTTTRSNSPSTMCGIGPMRSAGAADSSNSPALWIRTGQTELRLCLDDDMCQWTEARRDGHQGERPQPSSSTGTTAVATVELASAELDILVRSVAVDGVAIVVGSATVVVPSDVDDEPTALQPARAISTITSGRGECRILGYEVGHEVAGRFRGLRFGRVAANDPAVDGGVEEAPVAASHIGP